MKLKIPVLFLVAVVIMGLCASHALANKSRHLSGKDYLDRNHN